MIGRYYVGEWLVEPEQSRLVRGSETAKLDPKAVQVLSFLADHPNEVLTKEQIIDSVWNGAFVSDEVLTTAIWGLRKTLGDDAKEPRYIQTIPRRGYRLIAPVEKGASEASTRWEPSPYPGLSAFSQRDAQYFFGREAEVEALWTKLQDRNLLGLMGPSGAGKSSLLRAGVIPACPEGWGVHLCQPRNDPFRSFEGLDAWRAEHSEALLIVDQFEELFTLNDEETQGRFAEHLGRLSKSGVHVLLSMRDDFLIRCHTHPSLAPVFDKLTPVLPLEGASLRRALTEPARASGYRFEDEALVSEILTEVNRERGALPLLAFAAAKLWEKRDRAERRLTRDAYHSIGGVAGALAKHAEETLSAIGVEQEPIVREVFRNLTSAQGTRVPSDREELLSVFGDRDQATGVIGKLIDARLLTSSEREVEIIHESLLTAWPRLVRWQAQDAEGAVLRDQLRQAAKLWDERGHSDDLLWSGTVFRDFAIWRERYSGGLTATEEAFATAMTVNSERRRRRRRMAIGALIVGLSVGVAAFAGMWRRAASESLRAEASKLLALGQVELAVNPTVALAYAIRSLELADTEVGRLSALRILQSGPIGIATPLAPSNSEANLSGAFGRPVISPNGEWLALGGWHRVQLIHREGGATRLLGDYRWDDEATVRAAFGPKSDVLVANRRGDVRIWSLPGGRELRRAKFEEGDSRTHILGDGFVTLTTVEQREIVRWWPPGDGESHVVGTMEALGHAQSDAGQGRLAYSRGKRVYVRSLADWSLPEQFVGEHEDDVVSVAVSPDGQSLAASDASGEIRIWLATGRGGVPLRFLKSSKTEGLRFDPHGTRLAGVGLEGVRAVVRVWDLTAPGGSEPLVVRPAGWPAGGPAFEPTRDWLVTTRGYDATFWPLGDSHPRVLAGHEETIIGVAFSPDGNYVVSSGGDSVRAWSLAGGESESRVLLQLGGGFSRVAVDPASRNVVLSGMRNALRVVPLAGGPTRELANSASYDAPTFGDGGRLLAAVSISTPPVVRIWDLEGGAVRTLPPVQALEGHVWGLGGPRFVGQEKIVVSVLGRGLLVYDLRDDTALVLERPIGQFDLSQDGLFGVGVTGLPDQLADQPGELVRFTLDGEAPRTLSSHGSALCAVALNPTESMVATGGVDGTVRIGPVSGEDPHVFFGHEGAIWAMAFSPDGRWVASAGWDRKVRLWPVPDLSKPPLHTRPHGDLLRVLRSRTNLRVVPDPGSPTGWKLDRAPFPGWAKRPES